MTDETNNTDGYEMKMPETTTPPTPTNPSPEPMKTPEPTPAVEEHSHIAPIIGVLIVLIVLALGTLYVWGALLARQSDPMDDGSMMEATTTDSMMEASSTPAEESFDNMSAGIDADMQALDADLNQIDTELQAN